MIVIQDSPFELRKYLAVSTSIESQSVSRKRLIRAYLTGENYSGLSENLHRPAQVQSESLMMEVAIRLL